MKMTDFSARFNEYKEFIDALLKSSLPLCNYGEPVVLDAMKYSLGIGGKRIRPLLVLEFCRACGGDVTIAESAAKAIEMIHTYSLIHDDLPCMDNDVMRRGKPSCHVKFGESFALLAGDGLLTQAFCELSGGSLAKSYPDRAIKCISVLSEQAGILGMIGGQTVDLINESKSADAETLKLMDKLKTGALISAACEMGVICAGVNGERLEAAVKYAENIGQAFQIVDDILDVTSKQEILGKPVGSDEEKQKSTYVSLFGIEKAKTMASEYTQKAVDALSAFGDESEFLKELALYLAGRSF